MEAIRWLLVFGPHQKLRREESSRDRHIRYSQHLRKQVRDGVPSGVQHLFADVHKNGAPRTGRQLDAVAGLCHQAVKNPRRRVRNEPADDHRAVGNDLGCFQKRLEEGDQLVHASFGSQGVSE
jgi:hypothetical protein